MWCCIYSKACPRYSEGIWHWRDIRWSRHAAIPSIPTLKLNFVFLSRSPNCVEQPSRDVCIVLFLYLCPILKSSIFFFLLSIIYLDFAGWKKKNLKLSLGINNTSPQTIPLLVPVQLISRPIMRLGGKPAAGSLLSSLFFFRGGCSRRPLPFVPSPVAANAEVCVDGIGGVTLVAAAFSCGREERTPSFSTLSWIH